MELQSYTEIMKNETLTREISLTRTTTTTTIPLFALYLITYIKKRKKNVYIYLYLIRPGAEIILRFSSQLS